MEKAEMAKAADIIEVRADGLSEQTPSQVEELLQSIKRLGNVPVILTNRSKAEGGGFNGSEEARIEILLQCLNIADVVDVEFSAEEELRDNAIVKAKEKGIEVIVSHHDFERTPSEEEMMGTLEKMLSIGADMAKMAVTANSPDDVLRLLNVTRKASKKGKVITIAMGDEGRISRIVAPLMGSEITYASVGEAVAPGQLQLNELKTILEAMK